MTCSTGQKLAKEQIERLAASKGSAIEIYGYEEPKTTDALLVANVKIRCDKYERTDGGLPLRAKEHFCISVPVGFPFDYPHVDVPHLRFSGFPHVQWRRHLCLYQAPDTEWNPSDGMFGFFQRLDTWLAHGARNDLDPVGDPLHPPAIYPSASRSIVAKVNTPVVADAPWFGFANLSEASALRFDLDGWYELLEKELPKTATPAILLDKPFPFEYPKNVKDTIDELERLGISRSLLMLCLQMGAANTETDNPMYIVIGTPMRGIGGEGNTRKQHLAVWEISSDAVDTLKLIIRSENLLENINEENLTEAKNLVSDIKDIFDNWASVSVMKWCRVMEARSEVVERRDGESPMHWFDGKKVMIWGCGALGGHVAESIVRAGVRSLVLYDNKTVTPGIIQR